MKPQNIKTQATTLFLLLVLSNVALAADTVTNDHNNSGTGDTISNVDLNANTDGDSVFAVNKNTNKKAKQQAEYTSNSDVYQQMLERRSQAQQAQLEAYKRFLQNRNRQLSANINLPDDVSARRNEYIKNMEKRRLLMEKMREENRKAADERWEKMQLKMHQTNTASAMADKS